ncbi:uncharacterized protein [Centruroides vittatus]|uniref:uncharacterized protein n=1 Tax=Centruroides vittatus TaxID=120091 RepID=UPI00350F4558
MESLFSPIREYGHMSFSEFAHHMFGMKESVPSDARGSFYFKHQGSELLWLIIDEKRDFGLGKTVDYTNILSELAKHQKVDKVLGLYLDTSIIYPSISGGAFAFDIDGSVILGLEGEGKIDVRNAFSSPSIVDIEGKLRVSVASEMNMIISYISLSRSPSIKYVIKSHADVGLKGKLSIKDGRLFNLYVDLPNEKSDILSMNVDVMQVDEYDHETSIQPSRNFNRCLKLFRKIIGYDICTQITLPKHILLSQAPYIQLNGSFATTLSLLKQDRGMRGVLLNIELPDCNSFDTKKFKIEFDMPGSSTSKKHSLEIVNVYPSKPHNQSWNIQIDTQTPYKEAEAKVALANAPVSKLFQVDLVLDRKHRWALLADFETDNIRGNIIKYNTKIEFLCPNRQPVSLSGSILHRKEKKNVIAIELHSRDHSTQHVGVIGTIIKEGNITFIKKSTWKLSTDLNVKLPFFESRFWGIAFKSEKISSDISIHYQKTGCPQQTFKLNYIFQDLSTQYFTKTVTTAEIYSTQNPKYNVQLDWDFQYKPKAHLENELIIKDSSNSRRLLNLLQVSKVERNNDQNFLSENYLLINAPVHKLDYEIKFSVNHDRKQLNTTVNAEMTQHKHAYIKSNLKCYLIKENPLTMTFDFIFQYPGRTIKYFEEVTEISPQNFQGVSKLQWAKDEGYIYEYVYIVKNHANSFHHEFSSVLSASWLQYPMELNGLFKMNENSVDIKGIAAYRGKSPYEIRIEITPRNSSKLSLDLHYENNNVQFDNSDANKILKFDINKPETGHRI